MFFRLAFESDMAMRDDAARSRLLGRVGAVIPDLRRHDRAARVIGRGRLPGSALSPPDRGDGLQSRPGTGYPAGRDAREAYWDAVKGLAMLAVIAIHALVASRFDLLGPDGTHVIVLRQIVNFAVPVLLALSGFLSSGPANQRGPAWMVHRMTALLPPYLIWTAIFILLLKRSHLADPRSLVADVFAGTGIGIGYFVIVLVQYVGLTPLIARIRSLRCHVAVMATFTLAGLGFTYTVAIGRIDALAQFPFCVIPFPVWYPFYHLGFVAGQRGWLLRRTSPVVLVAIGGCVAIGWLASLMEAMALRDGLSELAVAQWKATSLLYSAAVCTALLALRAYAGDWRLAGLAWLGRNSYIIYLAHLLPLTLAVRLMPGLGLAQGGFPHLVAVFCFVLGICVSAACVGRRVLPDRVQRWIMG